MRECNKKSPFTHNFDELLEKNGFFCCDSFWKLSKTDFGPKLEWIIPKVFRKIEDEKLLKSKRNISTLILLFELCKLVSLYKI